MSFSPVLPAGGLTGWNFLQKTAVQQKTVMSKQTQIQREETYFRENIGKVNSANDLMADRRLLRVALGAFGLQDDLPNRAFIRKVLEEGTLEPRSLANKLSDKRYLKLSAAFGFDLTPPRTKVSSFPDRILEAWKNQNFERAVGEKNDALRLGMSAQRELADLANSSAGEATKWYSILGQPPLRAVFEGALGLPKAFGALPIERQKQILEEKSLGMFGDKTVSQFSKPEAIDALIRKFLIRSEVGTFSGTQSRASSALTLLQNIRPF